MSDINTSTSSKKEAGVQKSKKLSTRIDLTPMVDLGFLLITFFIFTTTMSQATAMKLVMPKDAEVHTPLPASKALTFLLANNNVIYYYEGLLVQDPVLLKTTSFMGMRAIIARNKEKLADPKDLMVIIKPLQESVYKNAVDALDEMMINDVKRYAMVDVSAVEAEYVELLAKRQR